MTIVFVRHAATDANEVGRMAVGAPGPPLSAAGRSAATAKRAYWRAQLPPHEVFVSPAARAIQTADILFPESESTIVSGFAEVDPGDWGRDDCSEGTHQHASLLRDWEAGRNLNAAPPNGESGDAVLRRLSEAVATLTACEGKRRIILISHFAVARMLLAHFLPDCEPPRRGFPALLDAFRLGRLENPTGLEPQ